eukprot:m.232368 g.232368  ORF g.232368 m.232368 type:complete len:516 (-) comp18883_c0_seq4:1306-2853(-)
MGLTCVVCGSAAFNETEEGFFICEDCGTQSQDVRPVAQDEIFSRSGLTEVRKRRRVDRPDAETPRRAAPAPKQQCPSTPAPQELTLLAFQHVLDAFVTAIAEHERLSYKDYKAAVGQLWFKYAEKKLGPDLTSPGMQGHTPKPQASSLCSCRDPPVMLCAVLCILAARTLDHPLLGSDMRSMMFSGVVPFFQAYTMVPSKVFERFDVAQRQQFYPKILPSAATINAGVAAVAEYLGTLHSDALSLPSDKTIHKLCKELCLCEGVATLAVRLLCMAPPRDRLLRKQKQVDDSGHPWSYEAVLMAYVHEVVKFVYVLDDTMHAAPSDQPWVSPVAAPTAAIQPALDWLVRLSAKPDPWQHQDGALPGASREESEDILKRSSATIPGHDTGLMTRDERMQWNRLGSVWQKMRDFGRHVGNAATSEVSGLQRETLFQVATPQQRKEQVVAERASGFVCYTAPEVWPLHDNQDVPEFPRAYNFVLSRMASYIGMRRPDFFAVTSWVHDIVLLQQRRGRLA